MVRRLDPLLPQRAPSQHGVDLGNAEITVGTSAGSLVGAFLTSEQLWRGTTEMEFLASHPALLARMVKTSTGSSVAAAGGRACWRQAKSTDREEIVEIGRAAMACAQRAGRRLRALAAR